MEVWGTPGLGLCGIYTTTTTTCFYSCIHSSPYFTTQPIQLSRPLSIESHIQLSDTQLQESPTRQRTTRLRESRPTLKHSRTAPSHSPKPQPPQPLLLPLHHSPLLPLPPQSTDQTPANVLQRRSRPTKQLSKTSRVPTREPGLLLDHEVSGSALLRRLRRSRSVVMKTEVMQMTRGSQLRRLQTFCWECQRAWEV